MIRLQRKLLDGLDAPAGLPAALQSAIELEHATIPTYLYALYSLDPAKNGAIAGLIQSVVIEEMCHMALACNLLNAIGGSPVIDSPGFVPRYPGALPGAVEQQLDVPLAPFSLSLVEDVFMVIEEPEKPLVFADALEDSAPLTIGQFYAAIRAQLPGADFSQPSAPQVTVDLLPEVVAITDVASAEHAIDAIVEQGEGTETSPMDLEGDELAHYYRFAEISHGRRLVKNPTPGLPPEQQFSYTGDPIDFDASGVRPAISNPKAAGYTPGSAAQRLNTTFNYTYTGVLKALHSAFNGRPADLDGAIGLMESCKAQSIALMRVPLGDGTCAGPSFEWQPTNVDVP